MPDHDRTICDSVYQRPVHRYFNLLHSRDLSICAIAAGLIGVSEPASAAGVFDFLDNINGQSIASLSVIAGLAFVTVGLGILFIRNRSRAQSLEVSGHGELTRLRAALDRTENLIAAQRSVNIVWEGDTVEIFGNPKQIHGLPINSDAIVAFHKWLDRESGESLASRIDELKEQGESFLVPIVTLEGVPLVAEGAAAGGRALVSFRAASETEQQNINLKSRCDVLEREVEASRALLSSLPTPVWISNPENNLDWVNPAYAATVGVTDASVAIASERTLFAPDIQNRITQTASAEQSFADTIHTEVSGRSLAYDVLAVPFSRGVIGLARDTSEQDALRGNLSRLVEVYARTMDQVETAVGSFDAEGKLDFFNSSFVRLWMLDEAWLNTKPGLGEILDKLREDGRLPEQPNYRAWKKEQLSPSDDQENLEQLWYLPDGRAVRILAGRHPYGTIYLYDDVTDQMRLVTQNQTLNNIQKETLDNISEGAALFSSAGRLRLHNPAFARIWNLEESRLSDEPHIEKIIGWLKPLHNDPNFLRALRTYITSIGDVREPYEARIERSDGNVFDCRSVPLPGGNSLVTFADVTDSFRAEQALMERNRALEEADEVKTRFVQHVSYVLRAPLNTIIGYADLLALPVTGKMNENQAQFTDHIQTATRALLVIVDDILDLATIEAGTMELDLASVDPAEIVASAVSGVEDRCQEADVTLDIKIAKKGTSFTADRKRVQQVLFNLLTNAIEHSPKGGVVKVACDADDENLALSVTDNGPGIAPRTMSMIFQKFERYPSGQGHRGPGLGLAIVKNLVELHGGEVVVDSRPGKGATFTCRFPLMPDDTVAPDA